MWLWMLAGCPDPGPSEDHAICGTLVADSGCALGAAVEVWTVLDGTGPCTDAFDTGGGTPPEWRDELVASADVDANGNFWADVKEGSYALYATTGDCTACEAVEVTGATCDPVTLTLEEYVTADAPNVYLYPEAPQAVQVRLGQPRALTLVDPPYPAEGWRVVAMPDGRLQTAHGPRDFLYYEQHVAPERMQKREGWCVAGAQAQASMEDAMADLGFAPLEIADFAAYWDAYFPRAETLTIYPQLGGLPALLVDPPPDSVLRTWFYVEAGCAEVPMPELPAFSPTGFVVREWGVVLGADLPRDAPEWMHAER